MKKIIFILVILTLSSCVRFHSNGHFTKPERPVQPKIDKNISIFINSECGNCKGPFTPPADKKKMLEVAEKTMTKLMKDYDMGYSFSRNSNQADLIIDIQQSVETKGVSFITGFLCGFTFGIFPAYGSGSVEVRFYTKDGFKTRRKESNSFLISWLLLPANLFVSVNYDVVENMIRSGLNEALHYNHL